ncbi:conserved hypothetical protein [Leishmania mexicana MHOM/GT/2001/U1103]|uniref:Uncharacterized protein n=1 Tax=Leishmania mexicana (strain MHOM/GT/2001/U1103) TaxID=929439 RepID=E9AS67_LEIMU|nr:conserved hypothetical protein [Leishmania mexicana MHOM/GT/2001/U1103]CBZ25788.1 conserved hypothetical protein [Leishmania mexicana MHOM/GT/2001/U1103]
MTALITKQRYNWMGYDGIESVECDTALLRSDNGPANNYNYMHRQQVTMELKERLYRVKRDLGLIPEEELRAEQEAIERRRMEKQRREEEERMRKEAEEVALAEEMERRRLEAEEAEEVEERASIQDAAAQSNDDRKRYMDDSDEDSDGGDGTDEQSAILVAMLRTQEEINSAVRGFTQGTRMMLASSGSGYVSYLDGSVHFTIANVEMYNAAKREKVMEALAGTNVSVPTAEEYSLGEVRQAIEARDMARKKLDVIRAFQDLTYTARIRTTEKDAYDTPLQQVTEEDGDMSALVANCEDTKRFAESVRKAYNAKAAASGHALSCALCMCPVAADQASTPQAQATVGDEMDNAEDGVPKNTGNKSPTSAP